MMNDEEKRQYLLRIGMTASLGSFAWGKRSHLVIGVLVYLSVLVIIFGGIIVAYFFLEDPSFNDFMIIVLGIVFVFIIALTPLICIFLVFSKRKKKILIWLEDAIEGEGITRTVDKRKWMIFSSLIKMKIEFTVNGVKYERYTGDKKVSPYWNYQANDGYYSGIEKFADKQVKIIYSPKYDEVMLLND